MDTAWLRMACAVLLLSLGFAHKPVGAGALSDPASSHYLLPDGTYAGLCIEDADHGKPEKSSSWIGCDVCRLASAAVLPTAPQACAAPLRASSEIHFALRPSASPGAWPRPGSPVRGPPFDLA